MTNEELKKKIKEILRKRMTELLGSCHTDEIPLTEEGAEAILFYADEFADALIAAGIGDVKKEKFECDHYWRMWQGALVELERAEHCAEVAERALKIAEDLGELCAPAEDYIEQAEKELSEEMKDENI